MSEPLRVKGREGWRRWLGAHHSRTQEVFLLIKKKSSRKPGLMLEEAIEEAIRFGWIDSRMKSIDSDEFLLRFTPRKKGAVWSLRNRQMAEKLIAEGRMEVPGLTAIEEARVNGAWDRAYTSKKAPETPPDLEDTLRSQPAAWVKFQSLNNSEKLKYVFWVNSAKKLETRLRRIEAVRHMLSN